MNDAITSLITKVAVLEERQKKDVEAAFQALHLQFEEYQRRLNILNGEAERLREMQATYLPREVWDNNLLIVRKELDELKAYRDKASGRQTVISGVIAAVVSFAFLLLNFVLK